MSQWWVYIVPEKDLFYVRVTNDPPDRLQKHGRPATCYLKGPLVHREAIQLQVTYRSLTIRQQRELVFGLMERRTTQQGD